MDFRRRVRVYLDLFIKKCFLYLSGMKIKITLVQMVVDVLCGNYFCWRELYLGE